MKKSIVYIGMALVGLSLSSCKKYLDINKSPNSAEKVDAKLLFSSATISYATLRASGDFYIPIGLAGQSIADGGNNPTAWDAPSPQEFIFSINFFGNTWSGLYSTVGVNLKQAIAIAEGGTTPNINASAQCKVVLANAFYDLTTTFGDVPFSEALRTDISYPKFDSQQEVLEGCLSLLDEALGQFDESNAMAFTDYDLFFHGDIAKWKRVANSLKLRILMTMVDKDPSKAAAIGALVTSGNLVNSADDNFQIVFQTAAGRKNPKFSLGEQYNSGQNLFFASKYVVDFMKGINDPRLPFFFDKPAAADNYYGITPGDDGDDDHDARLAVGLQRADEPELFFSYQEELFYEAEVYARGLGVTADLTIANTLYKSAVEASCLYFGVPGATAATFAAGLPDLSSVADPVKLIHYHHWVDKMDESGEAFTEWRRSGPDGDETPALTLPLGAPSTPLFRRYEYHLANELSLNPNAPAQLKYYEKMWFDL